MHTETTGGEVLTALNYNIQRVPSLCVACSSYTCIGGVGGGGSVVHDLCITIHLGAGALGTTGAGRAGKVFSLIQDLLA